jgi:exodeoxyribonuclease V gamma subunit
VDDVDSSDIDLVGRFAEFVDRVDHAVRELDAKRTVPQWCNLLGELVENLGGADQPWQSMQLRNELDAVAETATDTTGTDVELGLADVTALLQARLAGRPTRASFRTGTLTVCTLVPMRSVPHRVVCLLGMDDGAFPRQGIADGDDVLARHPRSGERDARSEDRQLFLDAVCAAQEHLIITYTGADPRTGAEVPPCVPLGELLDTVAATATAPDGGPASDHVVVRHPLQPFDPRNFVAGELGTARPFSFDPAGLAGARATVQTRTPVPPLVAAPLDPPAPVEVVGLDELVQFLQHPVRGFLRQRLDISTFVDDEEPVDALTVELDGLENYKIGERVLHRCLAGTPQRIAARLEYLRGELPPGPLGRHAMRDIGRRVDRLLTVSAPERETAAVSIDVSVPLGDGRVLAGTIPGVRGATVLATTYATLAPRHRLAAWVRYLALSASTGDPNCRAVTLGRQRDDPRRAVLFGANAAVAADVLTLLAGIRDVGLREPLPLALATSAEYATRRARGASRSEALEGANVKWETDRFRPERDEPAHVLAYGAKAPLTSLTATEPYDGEEYPDEVTRFGVLARLLWAPLLMVETVERQ